MMGLLGEENLLSVRGTFLHMVNHSLFKLILFLVAAVIFAGAFKISGSLYQWNTDRLIAQIYAQQEESAYAGSHIPETEASAAQLEETVPQTSASQVPETENTEIVIEGHNSQGTLINDFRTLNARTYIWKAAVTAIRENKVIAPIGTAYPGTAISVYNPFEVFHSHNSWLESLMRMGLPGLMMSLMFTVLSVWSAAKLILNRSVEQWKKILAMLTVCLLGTGFLEPYLFITNVYYHVTDFAFFFLTGYLDYWENADK